MFCHSYGYEHRRTLILELVCYRQAKQIHTLSKLAEPNFVANTTELNRIRKRESKFASFYIKRSTFTVLLDIIHSKRLFEPFLSETDCKNVYLFRRKLYHRP